MITPWTQDQQITQSQRLFLPCGHFVLFTSVNLLIVFISVFTECELGEKLGEYNFFFDPVDDNSFDCRKVEIIFKEGKDKDKDEDEEEEDEDEGKDDDEEEDVDDDDEYKVDENNRVGVRERFFGVFIGRDISAIGETMSVASLSYDTFRRSIKK